VFLALVSILSGGFLPKTMKHLYAAVLLSLTSSLAMAQGEASNYFNIFVPPNNEPIKRNVCLIVTAIFDDTEFQIIDDGADGDTDDSRTGTLAAGQSYVLYIADNGINDDARYASGGTLKQDGDYFIVRSNKNMLVSQSTNSDWQHDFVPSVSQKGIGERFIVYAPQISQSKRDLNTFVYEDSTLVTIKRISKTTTTITGYTNVDQAEAVVVGSALLNRGQDIIYFQTLGRDIMETGHTYLVESSKPITLQYGALFGNERDGGGNVPSANGSSAGELFYFAVPYQATGEQEIRIISWDDNNPVTLQRYQGGTWINMRTWTLNRSGVADWVGKSNGNVSYPTVFRVTCSPGKKVSVFEANWLETGNPGTSDMGTMVTAENGTSAGKKFIAYIAPPGNEHNVLDPFTGKSFGQAMSHLYIFSRTGATVTVRDAFTNGLDFNRTYTIEPERYVDCALTLTEWRSIYNGTGTVAGGPERPYLIVESDKPVSVFNTNFNDNWMAYLGTAQVQAFSVGTIAPSSAVIPGDTSAITTRVVVKDSPVQGSSITVQLEGNLEIVSSALSGTPEVKQGVVDDRKKSATFSELPVLEPGNTYTITTAVVATVSNDKGILSLANSVGSITTSVTGNASGITIQSVSTEGVFVNSVDQSQLMFTKSTDPLFNSVSDSWGVSLVDYNQDGWDDIFMTERREVAADILIQNLGNKNFTRNTTSEIINERAPTVSSAWADVDNDGDVDGLVCTNTKKPNRFLLNQSGSFRTSHTPGFAGQPGYYHGASWIDFDNDGDLDLFLSNYWPTKFNELWRNDGKGDFSLLADSELSQTPGNSVSVSWADYDNDGLLDVFLPDNKGGKNRLYHNDGQGRFKLDNNIVSSEGGFSVASCWGDVDGNGFLDLFVANASEKDNFIYLNQGGVFSKVVSGVVVRDKGHSHGCSFADVDNDGDLDLYVSNDKGKKFLYMNDGNGNFAKKENEVVVADFGKSIAHAWSDLDKDGDLDLVAATHSTEPNHLFWNNGNQNHWMQLKLHGLRSNRSAIGTRVRIKAGSKWQSSFVASQSGFGSQHSQRVHFGLGQTNRVDSLIIYWPSGITQIVTNVPADQFLTITEDTGGTWTAKFFIDNNNNCLQDDGEPALARRKFVVEPTGQLVVTDDDGMVRIHSAPGNYKLAIAESDKYKFECVGFKGVFAIGQEGTEVNGGLHGVKPLCNCADAHVTMFTTAMRRGFGDDFFVQVENRGNLAMTNVEVKVVKPDRIHVNRALPLWQEKSATSSNMEYKWTIPVLDANEIQTIVLRDSVTLWNQVGDQVTVTASATSSTTDANLTDNLRTETFEVVGAIDPNLIAVVPRGFGDEHLVASGSELVYTIHFENFGTYKTSFVNIVDSLTAGFDIMSISDIQASHQPLYPMVRDGILSFYFPHIELTPFELDSIASKGFVQFRIRTHSSFYGKIENRAAIFFDYNEPIITNTVFHNLYKPAGSAMEIFPNPARSGKINVLLASPAEQFWFRISDVRGVIVQEGTSGAQQIDVSKLARGMYLLYVQDAQGVMYGKFVVD